MRGEDAWTTGKFYKVVVQATLLFGLYFLVMTLVLSGPSEASPTGWPAA